MQRLTVQVSAATSFREYISDSPTNLSTCRFTEDTFWFKGSSAADKVEHEVTLELYGKINSDSIKTKNIGRCIEYVLPKADPEAEYWPRLTKSSAKLAFLRVDFKKWVDEDEVPEKMNDMAQDFGDMNFGNFMGGAGGDNSKLDFYDDALEDSDDEDLEGPPPAEDVNEDDEESAKK